MSDPLYLKQNDSEMLIAHQNYSGQGNLMMF